MRKVPGAPLAHATPPPDTRPESLPRPEPFSPPLEQPAEAPPAAAENNAILVAHSAASTSRLIRETLESFTNGRVFATSDPLRAFELALQRRYGLFLFAMQLGELSGPLLYEMISLAYAAGRGPRQVAPGVVFIREKDDPRLPESLLRDVRVKDVLSKPIRIERLLESVGSVLEVRDPTAGE